MPIHWQCRHQRTHPQVAFCIRGKSFLTKDFLMRIGAPLFPLRWREPSLCAETISTTFPSTTDTKKDTETSPPTFPPASESKTEIKSSSDNAGNLKTLKHRENPLFSRETDQSLRPWDSTFWRSTPPSKRSQWDPQAKRLLPISKLEGAQRKEKTYKK